MISRAYRFHGHGSLNYLHRNGTVVRNSYALLKQVSNKRRQTSRVAVVVSKKVTKSAVARNRIRRRVYEIIRRHWEVVPAQVDFMVTILSAETSRVPAEQLEKAVLQLFRRAGFYHERH